MTSAPSSEATPRPWKIETVKTSCGICHKIGPFPWNDKPNHACIYVDDDWARKHGAELHANAALIVAAVNSYDEREALLREAEDYVLNAATSDDDYTLSGRAEAKALLARIRAHLEAGK